MIDRIPRAWLIIAAFACWVLMGGIAGAIIAILSGTG